MNHEHYMRRCLGLAQNGLGTTYPNPMVGSVIVCEGKVIGEGWHRKAGGPHAEVVAIGAVKDKSLLSKSTIYVNLEPCSHFGKTPPCADLIIDSGIPNVVVGTVDPNEKVAGRGIQKLREAGRHVLVDVLGEQCRGINRRFFTFHNKKRPYVILKWAQSADGFVAPARKEVREPVWISNAYSRQLAHRWRAEEQAILVGAQTVIDDNPRLDVRHWHGKNPVRIVIDKSARIPKESHIFDSQSKTIVFTDAPFEKNGDLVFEPIPLTAGKVTGLNPGGVTKYVLEVLHTHEIQSVIVEGGAKTLQSFIDADLWDEARVFIGRAVLQDGVKAPVLQAAFEKHAVWDDELLIFRNHDQHHYL